MENLRVSMLVAILVFTAGSKSPAATDDTADIPMSPAWEIPLPDTSVPFLLGTAESLVVGIPAGRLVAHSPDGSGPLWEIDLGAPIDSAPVRIQDRIAIALTDGTVLVLRSDDGRVVSRHEPAPGAVPAGAPLLSATSSGFLIGRDDSSITLIEPEAGAMLWSASLTTPASAPGAQCGSHLIVGTREGDLVSIDPATGDIRWSRPLASGPITTAAACWHNRAFIGAADNRLYAVKLQRRKPDRKWSFLTGGDIAGRPVIHHDRLHFLSYDTYLYSLEADNGHLVWRVRLGRRPRQVGVLHDDRLVVAPLNTETLEVFKLPEGVQQPPLPLLQDKERFVTPPVLAGDVIVIAAARYGENNSRLIALDPGSEAAPSLP